MELGLVSHRTRSYQQEMFERSMSGNTVVVMDTGSGKTQVAILRIQAELDRCRPDQRVWFLAPTVELCIQQHGVLSSALPAYVHRLLTGADNVDHWSEQRIWDAALDQSRIVVSTHAVLRDGLQHGFVNISSLALLVFDEAHHCVKKHPANIIMAGFYHPAKASGSLSSVPHILGLSASLITKSNLRFMETVERNLDSVSVTPRIHREDLLRHVHRPQCQLLEFDPLDDQNSLVDSAKLALLRTVAHSFALAYEAQRIRLADNASAVAVDHRTDKKLEGTAKTLERFRRKADAVYENLGPWAAEFFINETLHALENGIDGFQNLFSAESASRRTLLDIFRPISQQISRPDLIDPTDSNVSSKVKSLISFLLDENVAEPVGIVFVEQRVTASVLSTLLRRHPATKIKSRCVPFVGTSNVTGRRYRLAELVDLKAQAETLSNFRAGKHNMVVATNALEEGIDVQSCDTVVCFDRPANIRSFIQRRGRARHVRSRLAILVSTVGDHELVNRWQSLEDELSKICQSDRERVLRAIAAEDESEEVDYELVVPSTGAKLTADAALQHLHHFCDKLPHRPHVDSKPCFSYEEDDSGLIRATVILPNCLSTKIRHASSQRKWRTERAAKKDVAFVAYSALHNAGLVNDNLLPLSDDWNIDQELSLNEEPIGSIDVSPQISLWDEQTTDLQPRRWHETPMTLCPPETLRQEGEPDVRLVLMTSVQLPAVLNVSLNWVPGQDFTVEIGQSVPIPAPNGHDMRLIRSATMLLYLSVRSERLAACSADFATLFKPELGSESLERWVQMNTRGSKASDHVGTSPKSLVRVPYPNKPPYVFHAWSKSEQSDMIQCERLRRKRNFRPALNRSSVQGPWEAGKEGKTPKLETFPAEDCIFDSLPVYLARVGLFMPDILQHIEENLISEKLRLGPLHNVLFESREHIVTAICAPSANRRTDYQRLEFLGDSILKFVVSCDLFVSKPEWHEGLLSFKRSQLVSNASLARAAIRTSLTSYIITETVSYKDWKLPVFSSADRYNEGRQIPSKMLADVVEALVGAAWVDSGMDTAAKCINIFLPNVPSVLTDFATFPMQRKVNFEMVHQVEYLIGYNFLNPVILLEALTHPSCSGHARTDSYQRLEFLGDAVLDMLVARLMSAHLHRLSQGQMTRLKAALVNARFLGFLSLDFRRKETHRAVQSDGRGRTSPTSTTREVHLAMYMRMASSELSILQEASQARYYLLKNDIRRELDTGEQYPWNTLLQLRPEKFYSDVIESILGAIFVDAKGSLLPCQNFIAKLGLRAYMERVVEEDIDLLHPRDRIQRRTGSSIVKYDVFRDETDGSFTCKVFVDGTRLAEARGCGDREEAIAQAASTAEKTLCTGRPMR